MAILAMKRIEIYGLKKDRKKVLSTLQNMGVMEVRDFVKEDKIFKKPVVPVSAAEFDKNIHDAYNALEIIDTYEHEPSGMLTSFNGRTPVSEDEFYSFIDSHKELPGAISDILSLSKSVAEMKAEIVKRGQQIDMLSPWSDLDVALTTQGTEKTSVFIGSLPGSWTMEQVYEGLAEFMPLDITFFSASKDQTCVMAICEKEKEEQVSAALRGMGFAYPAVSSKLAPRDETERLKKEIEQLNSDIASTEEKIKEYVKYRSDIKMYADCQSVRSERYSVIGELPHSEHTFVISGYAPEKYIPALEKELEGCAVHIEAQDIQEGEEPPVVLENNAFGSTTQGIVAAYSLPNRFEIDPSFIIACFYFLFFGFMLGDFCIGLLLFGACLVIILTHPNMEKNLKNNVKLFMLGGAAAMFWGIMFGSYFGDMLNVIAMEFFGAPEGTVIIPPLWVDMVSDPMTVLTFALALGLIHILTGMVIAAYLAVKHKDWMALFFDVIAWMVIVIGLVIGLLSMDLIRALLFSSMSEPPVPASIGKIGFYAAIVGFIAVIFFSGRSSKNWGKRILKGIYAAYGVTSYLSDLLSYSRLLALGLATGVIAQVANMIGTMFGSGIVKLIIYIVVFLIINALNIGINTLGAYVHTNRLQYVEFFSRFYEGGGTAFEPFSVKTKFYKLKKKEA